MLELNESALPRMLELNYQAAHSRMLELNYQAARSLLELTDLTDNRNSGRTERCLERSGGILGSS
jgi:hypothetical protein